MGGPGEQIFKDTPLTAGTNDLTVLVPEWAVATDQTYARFRLSSQAGLSVSGFAPDGEVEDYAVVIVPVDEPEASDDVFAVAQDAEPTLLNVLANDEGSGISISSANPGSRGGSVSIVSDQLQYTPAAGFVGQEALTYTITDGSTESTATVIVTVGTPT